MNTEETPRRNYYNKEYHQKRYLERKEQYKETAIRNRQIKRDKKKELRKAIEALSDPEIKKLLQEKIKNI